MDDNTADQFWVDVAEELDAPLEALEFLFEALQFAPQYAGEEPGDAVAPSRDCSIGELCHGFVRLAQDTYGCDYVDVLMNWDLATSEKLGELVFQLIARGLIERNEGDNQSDFIGRFDLAS